MIKRLMGCFLWAALLGLWSEMVAQPSETSSSKERFLVSVDEVMNGSFKVVPPLPESGLVEAGKLLKLVAKPDPGNVVDSVYAVGEGFRGWRVFTESMSSPWEIPVDQDMSLGASFIGESELAGFRVIQDVVYAQPGVKSLKYDVYIPDGAEGLPGIVIIHGGGWSSNTEDVMRGLARELVRGGGYVVFSIDYRWIGRLDGDEEPNNLADLIGDVYGAIAHIQEHASSYGLDPTRLALTGDSAGGHLSASAANMTDMIGQGGFGVVSSVFEYRPSYLPTSKAISQVSEDLSLAIRAAAPSYGVFGGKMIRSKSEEEVPGWAEALSPIETIPDANVRLVPHLLLRGTKDWIKHEDVQSYADALRAAGQRVEYVQVEGARHAFLDWKPDPEIKATFKKYAVPNIARMRVFFDSVFYP